MRALRATTYRVQEIIGYEVQLKLKHSAKSKKNFPILKGVDSLQPYREGKTIN